MSLFRDCLDDCGLFDLGFSGPKFTWNNRLSEEVHVMVQLDRVVANGDFTSRFDDCNVENIITTASDHLAILIHLSALNHRDFMTPVQQGFPFEAAWLRALDYREVLEKAWPRRLAVICHLSPRGRRSIRLLARSNLGAGTLLVLFDRRSTKSNRNYIICECQRLMRESMRFVNLRKNFASCLNEKK
jgi:hypothetical protein